MKPLSVYPIRTKIFCRHQNLEEFVIDAVPKTLVRENIVLAVTSKIVSLDVF